MAQGDGVVAAACACGDHLGRALRVTRRDAILGTAAFGAWVALGLSSAAGPAEAATTLGDLTVRPRSAWAMGLEPTRAMEVEQPEDVRVLLVHHSATSNSYAAAAVPGMLRAFYRQHTADNGWPDIAYNFLVDRFGTIWEGRKGSLAGPVKGDATGGDQGFTLLVCSIGEHTTAPPTDAANASITKLLAALADRSGIDTTPGTKTSFVSRGSNRYPAGQTVTTDTVSAHRDLSVTACPGDALYARLGDLRTRVAALQKAKPAVTRGSVGATAAAPAATGVPTTAPGVTTAAPAVPEASATPVAPVDPVVPAAAAPAANRPFRPVASTEGGGGLPFIPIVGGVAAAGVAGMVGFGVARHRAAEGEFFMDDPPDPVDLPDRLERVLQDDVDW